MVRGSEASTQSKDPYLWQTADCRGPSTPEIHSKASGLQDDREFGVLCGLGGYFS
jgi:hypothetical protein